jgi:hypothetical protein
MTHEARRKGARPSVAARLRYGATARRAQRARDRIELRIFNSPLRLRPHLVGIGDSHVGVVQKAVDYGYLRAAVSTCLVRGATAQGLHNPNSKTDAMRVFRDRCAQARDWQILVFSLGEVDCGFVIWYRAEKHGVSVGSQVQRSLAGYRDLLARQLAAGFRTMALSVPLPTIEDGQDWGEIANARREVQASQRDRTELTLDYNARLRSTCEEVGAEFLDVTTPTLDPASGLVRSEYLNEVRTDHHLHYERHAKLVGTALGERLQPS